MKNTIIKTTVCIAAVVIGTSAFAGEHHHADHGHPKGNDGVRLAASIIDLVGTVLGGPSVTVYEAPAPVYGRPVHCPPPPPPAPRHHHERRHDKHGNGGHGPGPGPAPRR